MAYLAGFVDGEGCVRWHNGPRLEVTNTHRGALEDLQTLVGGEISNPSAKDSKNRPCWRLILHGVPAEVVLFKLLPWLCIKRQQAQTVLDLAAARRRNELTPEALEKGLEFLKIEKAVAFDVRPDDQVS